MSTDTPRARLPVAVIILALTVFIVKILFLVLTPTRDLVMTPWIIDDTYINMRVARNIALGLGYSFNGIDPTTGTPFLWTYLTSVTHSFFPLSIAIKSTFGLSAFFAMLATIVAYAIAYKVTGSRTTAWTAFLLVTFTGNAFLQALNGMDTAIFTLLVLLSIAFYVGVGTSRIRNPFLAGAFLGIPVGLSILVRGDGLLLAFAIGFCLLWWLWTERSQWKAALAYLAGFCLTAGLGLFLLMLWGMSQVGSPFPANQVGRRMIALGWHNATDGISAVRYITVVIWNTFQMEHLLTIATGGSLLAVSALLYGFYRNDTRRLAIVTCVYSVFFLGMLILYQWYFPDFHGLRYINPVVHILLILMAVLFVGIFPGTRRWAGVSAMLCLVIGSSGYAFYTALNDWDAPRQMQYMGRPSAKDRLEFWNFYDWVRENIPAGSVVGVKDHGRFALFTDLPVQDLAGIIDPLIPEKITRGGNALRDYLRQKNVAYLWVPSLEQRDDRLGRLLHGTLDLELVPGVPPSVSDAELYRIRWDASR